MESYLENQQLLYEIEDRVAWITLNRPEKLNALNRPLWKALKRNLGEADSNDEVSVMIITGSGRAFCAGDDIAELVASDDPKIAKELFLNCIYGLVDTICHLEKPLLAAVNGLAYGGGCELVLISDMAVASEEARFAQPEARIGAWPGIFSVYGPMLVGHKATHEILMTTAPITAQRALELGLVNRIVPPDRLKESTAKLAKKIIESSPASLRITKETINRDLRRYLNELYIACQRFVHEVTKNRDYMEGTKAFLEKRQPHFNSY